MEDNILIITAASPKTWLRQKIDPRSWVRYFGEGFIPDYKEKMKLLREVDDQIYEWTKDFSSMIFSIDREMKNALKSNRLVDLATLLSDLNNRLKLVVNEGKKVENIAEKSLTEFDIQNQTLPEENMSAEDGLFSEAGFIDDWKRRWVSSQMATKERKDRFKALEGIIVKAKNTIQKINIILEKMHIARTHGKIGEYIGLLKLIEKEQLSFQDLFFAVYKKYLKPLVDLVLQKQKEEKRLEEEAERLREEKYQKEHPTVTISTPSSEEFAEEPQRDTIPGMPVPEALKRTPITKSVSPKEKPEEFQIRRIKGPEDLAKAKGRPTKPEQQIPIEQEEPISERKTLPDIPVETKSKKSKKKENLPIYNGPPTTSEPEKEIKKGFLAHKNLSFLSNLIKMAKNNNPYEVSATLLIYANKIDDEQPEAAEYLTEIAQQLIS